MLGVVCGAAHAFVSAPDTDTAAFAAGPHGGRNADGAKAQTDPASRRLALVIGNAAYAGDPLANPVKDARAFDEALRGLGFEVMRIENATRERMEEAIVEFQRRIEAGGVALFYYAGHGFQVADKTLLAAVDTDSRIPVRMLTRSMELRSVIQAMAKPRPGRLNLVILDTCLNNPFGTGVGRLPDTPEDTLIAYSTAPDSTAADRDRNGLNGLYTAHLLNALSVPGRELREIFERVESGVRHASAQRQIPWVASSLSGEFRFAAAGQTIRNRPAPAPVLSQEDRLTEQEARQRGVLPKDSNEQYELTFWESIKDSTHVGDYEAYLQTYPNGRFAGLAKARIERLRAAAPKTEAPKTEAPKTEAPKAEVPKAAPAPDAARQAPAAKPAETARPAPAPKSPRARPATPPAAKEAAPEPASPAASVPQSAEKASGQPVGRGEIKDCPTCPVLISLSPGSFVMGSNVGDPSEKPPHQVAIKAPFAIGKFEVTVEQWNACVSAGGCARIGSDGMPSAKNAPVRDVSWDDAQQYVKWISKTTGHAYRLPTEAEWEYAAKGGTSTRYWWGEQMRPGNANCKDCGGEWNKDAPAEIGSFPANPYGLHDVNGSVWEWVSDCWHNSYKGAPADGKTWDAPNCRVRVIRGGSWREGSAYMMSSTRFKYDASVRHSQNGFRVVRDLK